MTDEVVKQPEWKRVSGMLGGGNYILEGDGFYVSYNPCPGSGFSMFGGDDGSDETALVIKTGEDRTFKILNGDFRDDYARLAPKGLDACLDFYTKMAPNHDSSWTTDERVVDA